MEKQSQIAQEYNLNSTVADQDDTLSQLNSSSSNVKKKNLVKQLPNHKKRQNNKKIIINQQKQKIKQISSLQTQEDLNNNSNSNNNNSNNNNNLSSIKKQDISQKSQQITLKKDNNESDNENQQNLNQNIKIPIQDITNFMEQSDNIENNSSIITPPKNSKHIKFIEEEKSPMSSKSRSPNNNKYQLYNKSNTISPNSNPRSYLSPSQQFRKYDTIVDIKSPTTNKNKSNLISPRSPSKNSNFTDEYNQKMKKNQRKTNNFQITSPAFPSTKQVQNSAAMQMAHVKSTVKEYMNQYTKNLKQSEDSLTKLASIVNGDGKNFRQRNTIQVISPMNKFSKKSIRKSQFNIKLQSQSSEKQKKLSQATPSNRLLTSFQKDESFNLEVLEENIQEIDKINSDEDLTPTQKQKKLLKEQYKQYYREKAQQIQTEEIQQKNIENRLKEKFKYQYDKLNSQQQSFKEYKKKRDEAFKKICGELGDRKQTFSKFGFKSSEKQDVPQIKQITRQFDECPPGSMQVIDLWTENNIKKFLGTCKLLRDKMMINKMADLQRKQGTFMANVKPVLLSRKEENKLIKNIYKQDMVKDQDQKMQKELTKLKNEEDFNIYSQTISKRQSILERKQSVLDSHNKNSPHDHNQPKIHINQKQSLFSSQRKLSIPVNNINNNQQQNYHLQNNYSNKNTLQLPNVNQQNLNNQSATFIRNKSQNLINTSNQQINMNLTQDNNKNQEENFKINTSIMSTTYDEKINQKLKLHNRASTQSNENGSSKKISVKQRMLKNIIGKPNQEQPQLDEEYYMNKSLMHAKTDVMGSKWNVFKMKGNKAIYCKYCKKTTFMRHQCDIKEEMINEYQYDKLNKIIDKIDHIHDKNEIEYSKLNKKISKLQDRIFSKRKNR